MPVWATAHGPSRRSAHRLRSVVVAGAVAVSLLAACGGGSTSLKPKPGTDSAGGDTSAASDTGAGTASGIAGKSATEILRLSQAAAKKEPTVRLKGTIEPSGSRITLDIHIGSDGGVGTVAVAGKGSFRFVRQGSSIFIKGDDAFYRSFGVRAAVTTMRGKWIKGSVTDSRLQSFASLTDRQQLFDSVLGRSSHLTKGARTTIRNQAAIEVRGDHTVLLVATKGKPLPLRIRFLGTATGTLDLLEYGKGVEVKAPPPEVVIDVTKLDSWDSESTDSNLGTDSTDVTSSVRTA